MDVPRKDSHLAFMTGQNALEQTCVWFESIQFQVFL